MKILLLGSGGQLGRALQSTLRSIGVLTAYAHEHCDLRNRAALRETIARASPDVIVNAAAYTDVDGAELDPAGAYAVNGEALAVIGQEARQAGALVIHYSTDYVFDGWRSEPRTEDDETGPVNVYGKSKLAGERALIGAGSDHVILRTSCVMSAHSGNFLTTILGLAAEREYLEVVDDIHGQPTSAYWLAHLTRRIIQASVAGKLARTNLYHACSSGAPSRHAYAQYAIAMASSMGIRLRTKSNKVRPVGHGAFPSPAARPPYPILDCSRIAQDLEIHIPTWKSEVRRVLEHLRTTRAHPGLLVHHEEAL